MAKYYANYRDDWSESNMANERDELLDDLFTMLKRMSKQSRRELLGKCNCTRISGNLHKSYRLLVEKAKRLASQQIADAMAEYGYEEKFREGWIGAESAGFEYFVKEFIEIGSAI